MNWGLSMHLYAYNWFYIGICSIEKSGRIRVSKKIVLYSKMGKKGRKWAKNIVLNTKFSLKIILILIFIIDINININIFYN